MHRTIRTIALGASLAFIAASVAAAKPDGSHGNGHGVGHGHGASKPKGVGYVFKGTYVDSATVDVSAGNRHVKNAGLVGDQVSFDFSAAKVVVDDTNLDGTSDLVDILDGDKVVVKVKAAKPDPGDQPFAARKIIDQTHASPEDEGGVAV
ncbi:MAG: hypothetical protein ACXWXC_13075 [Aeromicrobium sp.]